MPLEFSSRSYVASASARGRTWSIPQISVDNVPRDIEQAAGKVVGNDTACVATVLANRQLDNIEEYLSPSFRGSMPDPYVLKGMRKAVARVVDAFEKGDKIALYGDYDVDGATSTAILVRHFRMLGR